MVLILPTTRSVAAERLRWRLPQGDVDMVGVSLDDALSLSLEGSVDVEVGSSTEPECLLEGHLRLRLRKCATGSVIRCMREDRREVFVLAEWVDEVSVVVKVVWSSPSDELGCVLSFMVDILKEVSWQTGVEIGRQVGRREEEFLRAALGHSYR